MDLIIYSSFTSPRLAYIQQQVFQDWLGISCKITTYIEVYKQFKGSRINYSKNRILEEEFFIPSSSILKENNIHPLELHNTCEYNKIPALFKSEIADTDVPFDVLATIFFHLSRYEEYLSFTPDKHNRFPASASWAYRNECLHLPIVDIYVKRIKKQLLTRFPLLVFAKKKFSASITYDIDMAWAYSNKSYKRTIGGLFRDIFNGRWQAVKTRCLVLSDHKIDPYQTFDYFDQLHLTYNIQASYFFLLGDYGAFDKNTSPSKIVFQQLIQKIAQKYTVGIHPSYQSNHQDHQLKKEIQLLATITARPITKSRQHFLKLHLPNTYRQLIEQNIRADYSMGYATNIGFRAGTSLPFYWYDLEKERSTRLRIHPFQVMDVTLKDYLQLSPEQAKAKISELIQAIQSTDGVFCSLWHNSSFSFIENWEGWKAVYEHLLKEVNKKEKSV